MKRWIAVAVALVVVVVALAVVLRLRPKATAHWLTATVTRQTLIATVTATGTVNPQDTILVGSQVSGTIQEILVDYNDYVHRGQVLARLDPTLFEETVAQAQGTLAQAQSLYEAALAGESSAQEDVAKARAALALARITLQRDAALLHDGYIARSQFDADSANAVTDVAAVESALDAATQAQLTAAAEAQTIRANRAQLAQAQTNLSHTIIASPTDGTVIARNVSVGQTVAAALSAPTLFTLGKDLARMEIDLNVGEPDVGNVRAGDPVSFSVLAYPNAVFHGRVAQVRQNPTTVQNVVTYDTVVYENNRDGRLRPGMTPTAAIEVARAHNAFVVPVAALAFGGSASGRPSRAQSSPWGDTGTAQTTAFVSGGTGAVLVVDASGHTHPVGVRITLVNGAQAAVAPLREGTLAAGDRVVVAAAATTAPPQGRAPGLFR